MAPSQICNGHDDVVCMMVMNGGDVEVGSVERERKGNDYKWGHDGNAS